jgi:two-component system sensor histidine kinase KdpD
MDRPEEIAVTDELARPSPEHFMTLIRHQQRGRLKIYLGFAAGVGKTYEMLQEGQRLKRQGVDVVVGIIETHGRAETAALVEGLEQVPRRRIEYRNVALEELDLDRLRARHPTIALVDELAHTNAPGSRHEKRYQDVDELLRAGINVITTLNVQHLESLHDFV